MVPSIAPTPAPDAAHPLPRSFHLVEDFLSAAECDAVEALFAGDVLREGRIGEGEVNPDIRRSQVRFLGRSPESAWIWDRLQTGGAAANAAAFGFDLDGPPQTPQLGEYSAGDQGHYGWHVDRGPGKVQRTRKLSVSILLTDPAAYTGGDLHLNAGGQPFQVPRRRGQAVFFPAYVVHRVTPVFQGTRRSLVAWFGGPPFR